MVDQSAREGRKQPDAQEREAKAALGEHTREHSSDGPRSVRSRAESEADRFEPVCRALDQPIPSCDDGRGDLVSFVARARRRAGADREADALDRSVLTFYRGEAAGAVVPAVVGRASRQCRIERLHPLRKRSNRAAGGRCKLHKYHTEFSRWAWELLVAEMPCRERLPDKGRSAAPRLSERPRGRSAGRVVAHPSGVRAGEPLPTPFPVRGRKPSRKRTCLSILRAHRGFDWSALHVAWPEAYVRDVASRRVVGREVERSPGAATLGALFARCDRAIRACSRFRSERHRSADGRGR